MGAASRGRPCMRARAWLLVSPARPASPRPARCGWQQMRRRRSASGSTAAYAAAGATLAWPRSGVAPSPAGALAGRPGRAVPSPLALPAGPLHPGSAGQQVPSGPREHQLPPLPWYRRQYLSIQLQLGNKYPQDPVNLIPSGETEACGRRAQPCALPMRRRVPAGLWVPEDFGMQSAGVQQITNTPLTAFAFQRSGVLLPQSLAPPIAPSRGACGLRDGAALDCRSFL